MLFSHSQSELYPAAAYMQDHDELDQGPLVFLHDHYATPLSEVLSNYEVCWSPADITCNPSEYPSDEPVSAQSDHSRWYLQSLGYQSDPWFSETPHDLLHDLFPNMSGVSISPQPLSYSSASVTETDIESVLESGSACSPSINSLFLPSHTSSAGSDFHSDTPSTPSSGISEDEYLPSPSSTRRSIPYSRRASARTQAHKHPKRTPTAPAPPRILPAKSPRTCQLRNIQVDMSFEELIERVKPGSESICPVPGCTHVLRGRLPDCKRHLRSHCGESTPEERWYCCGMLLQDYVRKHGAPKEVHVYNGVEVAGGCMGSFCRKDALLRHMRKYKCRVDIDLAAKLRSL